MKCDEVHSHVWDYLDGETSPAVAAEVEAHLASCAACKELFEEYGRFKEAFAPLPQEELPFDFEEKVQARFAEEKRTVKKPLYRRGWVKGLAACFCLVLALGVFTLGANLFAGKGSFDVAASEAASAPMAAPMDEMQYTAAMDSGYVVADTAATEIADEDFAPEEPKEMTETTGEALPVGDGVAEEEAVERKIIKNGMIEMEVADFHLAQQEITRIAKDYGGYVVSSSCNEGVNWIDGNICVRVDADRLEEAVEEISALGTVDFSEFYSDDVTMAYYDTQARLSQYKAQEERFLELYEKAETIQDMLAIEYEVVRLQSEIESMEATLRYYDQVTALSRVDIYLITPSQYSQGVEPEGWAAFGQDVKESFLEGINDLLDGIAALFVCLVGALPVLIILAVAVMVVVLLIRRGRKRRQQ